MSFSLGNVRSCTSRFPILWKILRPVQSSRFSQDVKAENDYIPEDVKDDFVPTEPEKKDTRLVERCINEVKLLGRVAEDPTEADTRTPSLVFPVATSSAKISSLTGEFHKVTEWHTIICYNADMNDKVKKLLRKGTRVYLTGKIIYSGAINRKCRIIMNDFIKLS